MTINRILLTNDVIEFTGFNLLKNKVTFCFYSGGIAITPDWKRDKLPCHYESRLDDNRKIRDPFLVKMLNERGIGEEDDFIKAHKGYIEVSPHRMP